MGLIDIINLFAFIMAIVIFAPWVIMYGVYLFGNKRQSKLAKREIKKAKREIAEIERKYPKRKTFFGGYTGQ